MLRWLLGDNQDYADIGIIKMTVRCLIEMFPWDIAGRAVQ